MSRAKNRKEHRKAKRKWKEQAPPTTDHMIIDYVSSWAFLCNESDRLHGSEDKNSLMMAVKQLMGDTGPTKPPKK